MSSEILVNICIPFYNASQWIEEALLSIKRQNYSNYKIYIFDDGSNDLERQKLNQIINRLQMEITIYSHAHRGSLYARYYMFNKINEGIILALDSDDYYLRDDVFLQIVTLFEEKNCDAVFFNFTNNKANKIGLVDFNGVHNKDTALKQFLLCNIFNAVFCKAFKYNMVSVENLSQLNDVEMADDRLISLALFENISTIAVINLPFYFYRATKNSIVNKKFDIKKIKDQISVERAVNKFAKGNYINYYNFENYVNEFIIYTDILYITKNYQKYEDIKIVWLTLLDYIKKEQLEFKISTNIKFHKKFCLILFYKKYLLILYLFFLLKNFLDNIYKKH